MKTQTRAKILEVILQSGELRPAEIQRLFNISAQVIHRHLKILLKESLIEKRGEPPFTRYCPVGIPNLKAVSTWLEAEEPQESSQKINETRDVFAARLPRMKELLQKGLAAKDLPLVIAITGELGNNCFDHNLGQWRNVPGAWVEFDVTGNLLWICVADRGQGIFRSLTHAHPHLKEEQIALREAFETIISGRAPESRGNGLKFVRQNIVAKAEGGVACMSGKASIAYGSLGESARLFLKQNLEQVEGTITLVLWRLS